MADWGLKISEDGKNVLTCTEQELIMSSSFNALKVKMLGTTSSNVAHGLAYKPIYFSCAELGTATKRGIVGQNYFGANPYIDSTNFSPGGTANTKYFIFYQDGN